MAIPLLDYLRSNLSSTPEICLKGILEQWKIATTPFVPDTQHPDQVKSLQELAVMLSPSALPVETESKPTATTLNRSQITSENLN
jgi:hypothetical protein